MEGDGMVAVVRGLREAGLAVTLLNGNRQYTLLPPNNVSQPQAPPTQLAEPINVVNAGTQQCSLKVTKENSTQPVSQLAAQCDRDAQAIDGRYTSMYKAMHCNVRPTSPPVQLTEFPPQRPEVYPGHGNFIVGGAGSGATSSQIRASSPVNSFRGGMSWPDRGSVCSPRPACVVDDFAKSLRKYPNCLSPDRSSEVMERLVNYSQANKGTSRTFKNSSSPTRISEPSSRNVLETKATFTKAIRSRTYEPDVTIRPKKTEDPPTRDRKMDENRDRPVRGYDVRCVRNISKRMREGVKAFMSYPYNHPVCPPTIRENQDYQSLSSEYQNSSNSVNMEIQAAVKMLSKEVATLPRGDINRKTVAVPESPISSAGEDYLEGEFYFVENLDIRTSIKSIQTNFYPSDTTLKPRKSAQTVFSTIDFHSSRNRTIVSRKTKSQEEIKVTKDELKMSLLQLINEISDTVSKNTIRDELIKKLFVTDNCEKSDHKCDRGKSKHDKFHKYASVCDYVGDYQELVGKLKHCYGGSKNVLRSEIKPFRISEYRQLDFVLKDWVSHLNLKTSDIGRYVDRSELLNSVEDRIKYLLKNWTKEDFDLKSEIVDILEEIPIEVNKSYGIKSYLRKLVDVLLKRMRNVIVNQQTGRIRRRSFASRSRKMLTEEDMRDYVRAHILDFLNECNSRICSDTLDDLETELVYLLMDSIDCIWCGHEDDILDEMNMILQDLGKMTDKQANCISNIMLQDLQGLLNNCVFNQTYTILNVSNNSGRYMNSTNNTDFSIESIDEEDLDANLDRYTNQLCLQINQWLDTLNIPRIQDSGFREVVVNDLAGDIVDRHKYVELNHTGKDSAQDQLGALKYQIFKWINKLVGDENQETINQAENLLQRINSVPVPMLVYPKHRSGGPCCEVDICSNTGQGTRKPYLDAAQEFNQSKPCCDVDICPNTLKDGQGSNHSERCCKIKNCPNAGQGTLPRGIQDHPGFLPHTDQTDRGSYGQGPQTANVYHPPQGQSSPNSRESGRSFVGPASNNNPWSSNTFSSGFEPAIAGNLTQTGNVRHDNANAGRMGTSGRTYGPMIDPNRQSMHNPNSQALNASYTESSPTRHGGAVPVKKLNEDYDEYLKEWVKKIPIAAKTPAEEQKAETARLGVYNGIWKGVTKMKLDPNIFGNQYYCQDVFEEEIERLLKDIPQSKELEAVKPTLKAELLQKTLAMNDLIKSTNAPASFKQQLIDNIENNLPERMPTENEADKENDELDKQNMADYYILYTRYKDEDNVKATVHQKNFLKKLDEFLNKIKNRHNIVDMDTTAYANEIINSFDKIPTPTLLAIKDEADDILLAMEVENWIFDIPQNPDNAGPLEKRRTRDAIVKKIQEIATDISCCDNAFRIPLKAELPRYLEKIPIQEGTNVDYMIDELANRIKNLSTSIRRVSFQDPQNYEEFSRNMPAASSMQDMSDEKRSYLVFGGDVVKDPGPRRPAWLSEQVAVPEEEIEWLPIEHTQMPSQMRSGYVTPQDMRSPQVHFPKDSGQLPQRGQSQQCCQPNASNTPGAQSPQVYNPNASYLDEGNVPRDADPNRNWGSDKAAVPQKRQRLSMQERRTSPNMRNRSGRLESINSQMYNPIESLTARSYPGEGNLVTDAGPMRANWGQSAVPDEEIQWISMEETRMPSQMRSGSVGPRTMRSPQVYGPNTSEEMASPRSCPGGPQQVQGQYPPNAQNSFGSNNQGLFSPNVQGQFTSYTQDHSPSIAQAQFPSNLQGTGPPCCPNPLCTNRRQGSPVAGTYSHQAAHSPGPRGPYGPGSPNAQVSPNAKGYANGHGSPNAQGFSNDQCSPSCNAQNAAQTSPTAPRFSGPGSADRYNQSFGPAFGAVPPNIQNASVPGGQIHSQAPHAPRQSQGPQASNVQGAPCCSVPNKQGQSFRPGQPPYKQVAPGVPSGQSYPGPQYPPSPNVGQGPAFNNNEQTFGPRFGQESLGPGQMPFQGPNGAQIGQVGQDSYCPRPNVPGSPQHTGQVSMYGVIEDSGQGHLDVHHNASAQAQVSRLSPTLNQTSQSPGPVSAASQVPDYAPKPINLQKMAYGGMGLLGSSQVPGTSNRSVSFPTDTAPSAPRTPSGAQALETDAIPASHISTDNRGIPQTTDQNQGVQKPSGKADQNLQVVCIPPLYMGLPKGCSSPDRERERCKCMRRGKKFKPRIKMDPNDGQVEYHPCMTMGRYPETQPTHNKLGTEQEVKPPEELKNKKIKPLDVNQKEVYNVKSVQTAFSTIDITTTKCKCCEIRSKSQEELTRKTKKQEVIKLSDLGTRDLHQEMTEWFEIHSDKAKVKLWGEKIKKLAEKLKKPGGEEKLRNKIEKYLKQAPEQYPEADDENLEFRKQLPNDIMRKLKQIYLCPTDANLSICRMEIPKYCSRYKIDYFRKAVQNWTKTLNIKKKDFLGRNVKKADVFKYVTDKLEPIVLDRPQSDSEYKEALQSNISEIVCELPLAVSSHNKDFYLNKVTENLVDNIFMIERKISSTYIQPTTKEIKEFVKDEITFFLEKCRIAISTKKMEYLETALIDLLLDLTDIVDIDNYVVDDVTKLLKEVVKLPEYKAKKFTNLLLKDYKEFFFRENFFQLKGNLDFGRPDVYSAFQNATGLVDLNSVTTFETYRQRLVQEINKWITNLNIPINDKNFMEVVVKDLANDIVDRYKYLLLNPNLTGTDDEELEQLKFQIFKWTNKLVGEENTRTDVLEHAQELMNEINNIPKPSFQSTSVVQSMSPLNIDKINSNNTKSYIDILTDQIYDWYCELPIYLHTSQDAKHNKILIKDLAVEIENGLEKKEVKVVEVIDLEVGKWTEKVFNNKISNHYVQELKNRIVNVPFTKDNRANDLKHEKNLIRSYEDMVDDWIDTVPIEPKKQELFTNNKNEIVHAIAVKIYKIKTKINHLPDEIVENKLQEELSHWLKKLPLHLKVDNQNERDKYASKLVKSVQRHNMNDSLENQPKLINDELLVAQLEKVLLEWLKKLPMYQEKSPEKQVYQEITIKRLAHKLSQTIGEKDADEDIIEQIRMLDPEQKDFYVKNTAFQLKLHLQKNYVYKYLCKQREQENKFLVDTIEVWLKGLPLQITDASQFNKQKTDFIKSIKRLISSGSDNAVMKKQILIFTRSLPISHKKKYEFRYLNEKVFELIQSLKMEPIGDVPNQSPTTNTDTEHHHYNNEIICDVIKEWTSTLPLKQVHSIRDLRSFINDMSSVISSILLTPENNLIEQNDAKLHKEISKFLRRFPLIYELSTESHIFRMAGELSKTLKNISLFRNENSNVLNNVTVYDVSVGNKNTSVDHSIQSIKESDINENLETYTKQLVLQIGEWLDRLSLSDSRQEGFKEVAINDLAGDIVDRHKYLELNPNNTGTAEDELEHLKYQIFKWINKLVGEENNQTIGHAQELMQRVNSIPVPMLVRPQDKGQAQSHPPSQHQRSQMNPSLGQRNNSQNVNSPIRTSVKRESGVSFRNAPSAQQAPSNRMNNSPPAQQATSNRVSGPNDLANPNSKPCCSKEIPPPPPLEEGTKDAIYDKYVKIFRDQCNAIPIDESTPYSANLADQARRAIYNGILKTFFNLKSNPIIKNDYKYFEFMLEEKLDDFLDVLPQTEELKKIRHSWKITTIERAIEMLDELHKLSDKPCFRRTVKEKFNRQFALDNEIQYCFLLQQGFLSRMADAYILQTNYKEKDPVKANIYRNRLMMEVDKLANHLSKVHNVGFRFFDTSKLSRMAMKTLEHVPVPADDVLQEEVEQIHIADEIEKWYKELPTRSLQDESDGVFRKRMMEILAKKLNDMHKRLDDKDPSKEDKMKHEISHFLEKRAELQKNEDKNINFMVDQLHFRLQNRWAQLEDPGHFEDFEKAKPFSSTLAHFDNADFLTPLMDAATSTGPEPAVQRTRGGQEYFIQPGQPMQSMGQVRTSHGGVPYSLQGSGHPGSPQKAIIHSMDPKLSRPVSDGTRMSQGRPNEWYVSQHGAPIQSMQATTSPRVNFEGSQFGPTQVNITQQSPQRPNLSQKGRQPTQSPVVRQSPQLIQSTAYATPKNARGANQIGSQRAQNINQSLRQVGFAGQTGPHPRCVEENVASQILGSIGQPHPLSVPFNQVHSQEQSGEVPGIVGSRGPTPSEGGGTTAQAATGAGGSPVSSEEDILDGDFHVKCGCLEVYRRMQRFLDLDCDRFRP